MKLIRAMLLACLAGELKITVARDNIWSVPHTLAAV